MKRLLIYINLALILTVAFSSRAAAAGSAVAKAMNDVRWGMSEYELALYLQTRIKAQYSARIKKASGFEKHRLEQEVQSRLQDIQRDRVAFDGQRTRWDSGLIAYEFTHNNGETMMVDRDNNSINFYFFINRNLWKWYKAYNREAFRGKNFKQVLALFENDLGRGIRKEVERVPGAGTRPIVEWRDRDTRARALDESEEHGQYCLVFEDLSTVAQLASYRISPDKRFAKLTAAKTKKAAQEQPVPTSAPSRVAATNSEKPQAADSKARKSVFVEQPKSETKEEYDARRQRILEQRAGANRKRNEQKLADKRAQALDSLKGLDNNDPLGGL
jgi:hypothetical protein